MNQRGADAESLAARHLTENGLRIIERNYRTRFGEIDLIARDGTTLVFVEVRQRRSSAYGGAAASITISKQKKLLRAARQYLGNQPTLAACRFDAVLIEGSPARIEWVRDAFGE